MSLLSILPLTLFTIIGCHSNLKFLHIGFTYARMLSLLIIVILLIFLFIQNLNTLHAEVFSTFYWMLYANLEKKEMRFFKTLYYLMFIVIIIHKITAFIDHTSQASRLQQQVPPICFAHNPPLMSARLRL